MPENSNSTPRAFPVQVLRLGNANVSPFFNPLVFRFTAAAQYDNTQIRVKTGSREPIIAPWLDALDSSAQREVRDFNVRIDQNGVITFFLRFQRFPGQQINDGNNKVTISFLQSGFNQPLFEELNVTGGNNP